MPVVGRMLTEETAITLTQIDERLGDVEYYKLNGVKVDNPHSPASTW